MTILAVKEGFRKITENVFRNTKAKHFDMRYHFMRDDWHDRQLPLKETHRNYVDKYYMKGFMMRNALEL
jgi:hypothetical protein